MRKAGSEFREIDGEFRGRGFISRKQQDKRPLRKGLNPQPLPWKVT